VPSRPRWDTDVVDDLTANEFSAVSQLGPGFWPGTPAMLEL
jgi:hypothetical protein